MITLPWIEDEFYHFQSSPAPSVPTEAVHVSLEEKILMTVSDFDDCDFKLDNMTAVKVGRDGGLQGLEVLGFLTLRVADESFGRIR